ncbi:MAG: hypothetical protein HSCHL_0709 [Hydrogenibacillus schlegelii]|uniref:Glycosyltransferase RgtA/B/C/D-like domain-containing protein n=1 Tax=Hydrogenibacillus schlegelii TaxID=1484 RepID=A0A2T5G7V9_HYDSH|nr:hypothetical protein [Hydrogenibacillus schlegelii]PTQ52238.1 MAG: hypothetical protein HSCHL_0709 [Hydrogenibacillus schlegelii]
MSKRSPVRVLAALLVLFGAWMMAGRAQVEGDTLWHIRVGKWIVEHGEIPKTGLFSWSAPDAPWHAHEWLWEVLAYSAHSAGGFSGVWGLTAAGVFLFGGALFALTRRGGWPAFFPAAFAVFDSAFRFNARPHAMAFGLWGLWIWFLDRKAPSLRGFPVLAVSFLMTAFWANVHASAAMAVFFALVYAVFRPEARRAYLPAAGGAFLGSLANPWGAGLYPYAYLASRHPEITENIAEWASPNFHDTKFAFVWLTFLVLSVGVVAYGTRTGRLPAWGPEVVFTLTGLVLSLVSVRNYPYFYFTAAWLLSRGLEDVRLPERVVRFFRHAGTLFASLLFLFGAALLPPDGPENPREGVPFPVEAVRFMKEHGLTDRVMAQYQWGGYLIFNDIPAFIDGRADMYVLSGSGILNAYTRFMLAQDPKTHAFVDPAEVAERYGARTAVLLRNSLPAHFLERAGWSKVYEDDLAVVLVRGGEGG